jgi:hypothetical protein
MSSEPVRSYLLGTLEENSAATIEERYFTDRAFFLLVQSVERALIDEYLSGLLEPSTRARFEQRYLSVPELRQRLEEVRRRKALLTAADGPARNTRTLLAAAALLLCIAGAALWVYLDHMRLQSLPGSTPSQPVLATVSLSPGLAKGEGPSVGRFRASSEKGDVRLVLELPGPSTPLLCSATLAVASPEGGWKNVWLTPKPVWSTAFLAGQQITLILDSSLLQPGDYQVKVTGVDKQVQEAYFFHVTPI